MGRTKRASSKVAIADALFSSTKQRVLGLLFGQPDRGFGLVELIELADSGRGAVQRELERLVAAGLVTLETFGQQKRYRANQAAPIYDELRSIVEKTGGVAAVLRAALRPLAKDIELAILYGSVPKHADTASSDIDVLVVSNVLALEDVYRSLQPAEVRLGRKVSPTLYNSEEFEQRKRTKNAFIMKVLSGKHIVLIEEHDDRTTR
jgi:predicted nucleotidyltransferase